MASQLAYGPNPHAGIDPNAIPDGWGPYQWPQGVPSNLLGSFTYKFHCANTTTATITLRKELVPLAKLCLQIADAMDYPVYGHPNPSNERTWGPWSYENRPIGGTSIPSNHSKGRAWDWNAPRNPQSYTFQSDIPAALVAHMESVGWYWGGRYVGSRYDTMHFEFILALSQVPAMITTATGILAALTGSKGEAPSPVKPAPAPKPSTPRAPAYPLPPGYYYGPLSGPAKCISGRYKTDLPEWREGLKLWQQRMRDRGWRITPDGYFGPQTAAVARAFKAEKHVGDGSGNIGRAVWRAAWTEPVT